MEAPEAASVEEGPFLPAELWRRFPPLPKTWLDRLAKARSWSAETLKKFDVRLQTIGRRKTGEIFKIRILSGNAIGQSNQTVLSVSDPAPAAPTGLHEVIDPETGARFLSWAPPAEADVVAQVVREGGAVLATLGPIATGYSIATPGEGESVSYTVGACDTFDTTVANQASVVVTG